MSHENGPEGSAVLHKRPGATWRRWVGVALVALGLYATVAVAARLIHRSAGYDPGAADCDDCGITILLDNLGWLAAAGGGYFGLLVLTWWLMRRRSRSPLA